MKDFLAADIKSENAILVGIITPEESEERVTEYLDELKFLAQTAKITPVHRITQRLPMPNSVTFVGSGKLQEIKEYIENKKEEEDDDEKDDEIGVIIFDDELSARQIRNIEQKLNLPILDRTSLIL